MNTEVLKRAYEAPGIEVLPCPVPLPLLVSASVEADIEDWEIGDEL